MSITDITLKEWKKFDKSKAEKYAKELVFSIPQQVVFDSIKTSYYADQEILLAQFRYDEALFSLIPGGEFRLGFDLSCFTPSKQQLKSFQEAVEDTFTQNDIYTEIQDATTPPRIVELPTLLVETSAKEIGYELIDSNEPEIQKLLKEYPKGIKIYGHYDIRKLEDSSFIAYKINMKNHKDIVDELSRDGLRLLTINEWEYVCGAGKPTLFRWGNDCPCDRYPVYNDESISLKKELEFDFNWNLHLIPNLFGLTIAQNPYKLEILTEVGHSRGGDGGSTMCGGSSYFFPWLTLSTHFGSLPTSISTEEISPWSDVAFNNYFFRRVVPC